MGYISGQTKGSCPVHSSVVFKCDLESCFLLQAMGSRWIDRDFSIDLTHRFLSYWIQERAKMESDICAALFSVVAYRNFFECLYLYLQLNNRQELIEKSLSITESIEFCFRVLLGLKEKR